MAERRRPAWEGSTRRETLPDNWYSEIRPVILERDGHRCQIRFDDICVDGANQVDHIGDRHDHRPENLRAACEPCHQRRSSQQGRAARVSERRPPEAHPAFG
jgi:5-methylcytosine-specific restriction protein A